MKRPGRADTTKQKTPYFERAPPARSHGGIMQATYKATWPKTKTVSIYTHKKNHKPLHSTLTGIAAAAAAGLICIPLATAERGYTAIGGEWICIIAAFFVARWIYKKIAG
jgi:hypothetical protein